ncbi:efflux RND transporter periplasmic adaptor subunit [Neobacillus thermocopriae]|uniref:Biotin/lipoyl-binding protein n=1 Tax=Neobacillus thermocopriae TaxID=1215031 RepID=A0A6B3TRC3_9BACI|nr:biotin/lipoyl-binding protein [Neobacillus thermocopriae]NEX79343.1 biotin/lipoyl-binding protein [Neobacillus thermocopriae]
MEVKYQTTSRKKWIIFGIITIIVIVAALNIVLLQKKPAKANELSFVSVIEKEMNTTKLIAGKVVPGAIETIYPDPTKGKVVEIFVQEGQEITKGQKLFSYDDSELSFEMKQLEIDKKTSQMRYEQVNEKMNSLRKEIKKAKEAEKNNQNAELNAQLKETTKNLEAQLKDLEFEKESMELEKEKFKLQEEQLHKKQNNLIVYSNTAGIVQKVAKDDKQSLSSTMEGQGNPIVQIVSKEPYQIQGQLSELQKAQILPNQPIKVTSKAVADKTWTGKIIEVSEYPLAQELVQSAVGADGSQNISYYNFKGVLDSQEGLSPGYHVTIQVIQSAKTRMSIPRSCIKEDGDSQFVYVLDENKLRKQQVTTGIEDGKWTEILTGLKVGDKVVKNPSDQLSDGMEVN